MEFILSPSSVISGFLFLILPTLMMAVYKWFEYLKQNNHFITGYVIMPNHLHALIAFSNSGKNINRIICNGKRFMAYDIIAKLIEKGNENILNQLAVGVNHLIKKEENYMKYLKHRLILKNVTALNL